MLVWKNVSFNLLLRWCCASWDKLPSPETSRQLMRVPFDTRVTQEDATATQRLGGQTVGQLQTHLLSFEDITQVQTLHHHHQASRHTQTCSQRDLHVPRCQETVERFHYRLKSGQLIHDFDLRYSKLLEVNITYVFGNCCYTIYSYSHIYSRPEDWTYTVVLLPEQGNQPNVG